MKWYRQLHWQILMGLGLGVLYGVLAASLGWGKWTSDWIAPFGEVFIRLLKLIAIPLVLTSLISGVASLTDVRKLSRIGGRTIFIYLTTTALAVTLGLFVVNLLKPGNSLPAEIRQNLENTYNEDAGVRALNAMEVESRGPLQALVDMVPNNFFSAASNSQMLQLVFFSILFGVALVRIEARHRDPVVLLVEGLNHGVISVVHLIMILAPVGVFGLIADTINKLAKDDPRQVIELLAGLGYYCLAVVIGLLIQTFVVYPLLVRGWSQMPLARFFKGIGPAQLLAFTTSSSGATLPVTMEQCEKKLGVSEEVASFVLPLGATINMDGTALYQAVAAVFIAQATGIDLELSAQLKIILMTVLASIGTAAVPGAGIIMLVIILKEVHVPEAGIALILGVDRILDMLRTATNVTGDAAVSVVIADSEGELNLSRDASQAS